MEKNTIIFAEDTKQEFTFSLPQDEDSLDKVLTLATFVTMLCGNVHVPAHRPHILSTLVYAKATEVRLDTELHDGERIVRIHSITNQVS